MNRTRRGASAGIAAAAAALLLMTACSTGGTPTSSDAPAGSDAPAPAPAEMDHVTIQLDFQPRGLHSIFFVADELGFFEEEGIIVDDILTGTSSGETLRMVGSGQGDFGMADLPTLVVAQSQDVPVTALAAVNQVSPLAMCTLASEHTLNSPEDLRGLTVGVQASGSTYVFYKALLALNGIEQSELTELTVNPPYEQYLLTGQVDTVPCYTDAEITILEAHAGGEGSLSVLLGSDWGYTNYGTGVFASDEMVQNNPDLVQRFMNAYIKALNHVMENPDEAAEILAASSPQLADNVALYTAQITVDVETTIPSEWADEHGLGTMDPEVWQSMIDMLKDQGVIERAPTVEEVMDGSFVENAQQG